MHLAPLERLRVHEARGVAHGRREIEPPGRHAGAVDCREQRLARPRPCHTVGEDQPHAIRRRGGDQGASSRGPQPIEHRTPIRHGAGRHRVIEDHHERRALVAGSVAQGGGGRSGNERSRGGQNDQHDQPGTQQQ